MPKKNESGKMNEETRNREFPGRHRKRRKARFSSSPRKIETLSKNLLGGLQNIKAEPTSVLISNWEKIAGSECAENSEPVMVDSSGALHIVVENPAWVTKLEWQSAEILKNAKKFLEFDAVSSIKIRIK